MRGKCDYVFTSGGIGPTHDDITAAAIAKAFSVKLVRNPAAQKLLEDHYPPEKLNDARLKMADIPEGGVLLNNPVSSAPGFKIENVFVFAGVPTIMQSMFEAAKEYLEGGDKKLYRSISAFVTEGEIAHILGEVQDDFPDVEIGSYPFIKDQKLGTSIVFRSVDEARISEALDIVKTHFKEHNFTVEKES
jgi:molybdopterin-biosynthesis enzyme MoeA-like protein